jgi:hypothetical protein
LIGSFDHGGEITAQNGSEGGQVPLADLLERRSATGEDTADGPRNDGGPWAVGGAEERAGAEPRGDAVDPVVLVAEGDHGALDAGVHETNNSEGVADAATGAAAGVEDAVGPDLGGLPGLRPADGVAEAERGAPDGAGEVPDAGVVGEVLAPGAALRDGLLLEEELRRGGQIVELLVGDVEVLVRTVEAAARGVPALVRSRREEPRIGHGGRRRRGRKEGNKRRGGFLRRFGTGAGRGACIRCLFICEEVLVASDIFALTSDDRVNKFVDFFFEIRRNGTGRSQF